MRPRSPVLLLAGFVLVHTFAWIIGSGQLNPSRERAVPITIYLNGHNIHNLRHFVDHLEIPLPANELKELKSLRIDIGTRRWEFTGEEVRTRWQQEALPPIEGETTARILLTSPPEVSLPKSLFPFFGKAMNWPGDLYFVRIYLPWVIVTGLFLAAAWFLVRRASSGDHPGLAAALRRGFGIDAEEPAAAAYPRLWWLGGLLTVLVGVGIVERLEPYYFMQDDNLVEWGPTTLYGCQALSEGHIPEWTPYQLGGAPVFGLGFFGLTYPPLFLSFLIARDLLGDPYCFGEVFAFLHMTIGYALMFLTARRAGLRPPLAMAGSVSVVLCGFTLILGRCWLTAGTAWLVWLPLMTLCLLHLLQSEVGRGAALLTGLVIGVWYHVGFTPLWIYGVGFVILGAILFWRAGELPSRRLLWAVVAGLHGLGLALPFLLVQMDISGPIQRDSNYGNGIARGSLALFLPYPLVEAEHPNEWGGADRYRMGHLYFAGALFSAATLLAGALLVVGRIERIRLGPNVWLVLAGLAWLLCLGHDGGLWVVLSNLPIFGPINNHPFRLLFVMHFFAVLGGGLFLQRALGNSDRAQRVTALLAFGVAGVMLYHAANCKVAFWSCADRPYPELPSEMRSLLGDSGATGGTLANGRILSVLKGQSTKPGYLLAMKPSMSIQHRVPSIAGYNPILESTYPFRRVFALLYLKPEEASERLGIAWLIDADFDPDPPWEPLIARTGVEGPFVQPQFRPIDWPVSERLHAIAKRRVKVGAIEVYELPTPDAFGFWTGAPKNGLPVAWFPEGVRVDTSNNPNGGELIVNFLYRRQWHAYAADQPIAMTADPWQRMKVTVPTGTREVTIRFEPPWRKALRIGVVIELIAFACGYLLHRRLRTPAI